MRRIATVLALVTLTMPAFAEQEQEVRCREIGFSKSVEMQDHELFASFIDPDARFISGKVDRGREAIAEAWKVFFAPDSPSIKWRPQYIEVLEGAELALSRGPYRIVSLDEQGETVEAWGTFNSVWRLTPDGEWLVVFDAGSAPDETPTDEQRKLMESDAGCD